MFKVGFGMATSNSWINKHPCPPPQKKSTTALFMFFLPLLTSSLADWRLYLGRQIGYCQKDGVSKGRVLLCTRSHKTDTDTVFIFATFREKMNPLVLKTTSLGPFLCPPSLYKQHQQRRCHQSSSTHCSGNTSWSQVQDDPRH